MFKKVAILCLVAVVLLSGCGGDKAVTTDDTSKVNVEVNGDEFTKGIEYKSQNLGFKITFPTSWKDKYSLVEVKNTLEINHVTINNVNDGRNERIFTIAKHDTKEDYEKAKTEMENFHPYKRIGQIGDKYYAYYLRTDVAYADEANAKEFREMTEQIEEITKTLAAIQDKK